MPLKYVEFLGAPGVGKTTLCDQLSRSSLPRLSFDLHRNPAQKIFDALFQRHKTCFRQHADFIDHARYCFNKIRALGNSEDPRREIRFWRRLRKTALLSQITGDGLIIFHEHLGQSGCALKVSMRDFPCVDDDIRTYYELMPKAAGTIILVASDAALRERQFFRLASTTKKLMINEIAPHAEAVEKARDVLLQHGDAFIFVDTETDTDPIHKVSGFVQKIMQAQPAALECELQKKMA